MPKDYTTLPYTQIRRSDRAVEDDQWIKDFLHQAPMGVLATANQGQPFINTNLFVYNESEHVIYIHTARVGRTPGNIGKHTPICFTISSMGRLLPAKEALEFSLEYASVMVFGQAILVDDPAEAKPALQLLLDKYFPHLKPNQDYREIIPEELRRTAVYRVTIEQWSGKKKAVEPDFPGAFFYGAHDS